MAIKRAAPLLICLLHLAILISPARQHPFGNYATETDFYHLFAPDAGRLLSGQFPENTFQAPGYPTMLAAVVKATGLDIFTAGKWLSVVSAALCGLLIFLLFQRLFGYWVGLGSQALFIVSGEFPQFAINATTDVFFLMLCLAALATLLTDRIPAAWRNSLAAFLTGLAYLTRYNGLFLVAACLMGIVLFDLYRRTWADRFYLAGIFLIVFLLTASPWFYFNARHHGSPFYNTNYLNMATEFYPELVAGKTNQDGTRALEEKFKSFGDVFRHDPKKIVSHYPVNLRDSLRYSLTELLVQRWVGWLAWLGVLLALLMKRTREVGVVLATGLIYLLLMGLNHWETRYYFFLGVLYAGFAVYAISALWQLAQRRGGLKTRYWAILPVGLFALLWGLSLRESREDVRKFLAAQPWEIAAARDYLLSAYPSGTKLRIVARKPHLPYMVNGEWIFFPQVKSIEEFQAWVRRNDVDYIVIGKRELKERKELAPLGNPMKAPEWLNPVWTYEQTQLILYQVGSF